jgi:hypothetical protein
MRAAMAANARRRWSRHEREDAQARISMSGMRFGRGVLCLHAQLLLQPRLRRLRATFEPETKRKGRMIAGITPPDPLPDATDPTTECAACGATAVYLTEDGAVVCGQCGAALELEITEVDLA